MPVVDSNTRLLDTSTVIASRLTMGIQEGVGKNIPLQARLLAVAKESSMDNADVQSTTTTTYLSLRSLTISKTAFFLKLRIRKKSHLVRTLKDFIDNTFESCSC